ncbi:MAG: tRNA (N6-threonylcarbamoyladenosine(37)-N6)-methyltransferase TrmO [Hyphomicrobiaceae bacterium]|nr:tRNA (N6-threonylcarbamoyladenosine(37)-N6)-methyltransferase TrmO [Hyphomicrobiaceae bacterium]
MAETESQRSRGRAMSLTQIGVIRSPHTGADGTPIQPRMAEGIEGTVEVFAPYEAALADVAGFERIWLLYWFDRIRDARLTVTPFMDDVPRGLFATRAPCRPNPIGISSVRLLGVEGRVLRVADVDILDGTPLLDIKPYTPRFDVFEVSRCGWLDAAAHRRGIADDRFERPG